MRVGFDPLPVLARFPGACAGEVAEQLGVSRRTVVRWRNGHTGVSVALAETIATKRMGLHPATLWPHWFDLAQPAGEQP